MPTTSKGKASRQRWYSYRMRHSGLFAAESQTSIETMRSPSSRGTEDKVGTANGAESTSGDGDARCNTDPANQR